MTAKFELTSKFQPAGDQPQAIDKLVEGFRDGRPCQTLLGATGTGKTFTASNVIAQLGKPTLVLSHNKTLAAQLYKEFRAFFPRNAVHYFVSYYDYYQPEAYIPQRDIYIEKDALINENIDRLRLAATSALVSREDVIIVASVSCIYGLGSPSDYKRMMVRLAKGEIDRPRQSAAAARRHPVPAQRRRLRRAASSGCAATWSRSGRPTRNSACASSCSATRSTPWPSSTRPAARRCEQLDELYIYPAKHFVTPEERISRPSKASARSWKSGWRCSSNEGKLLEAQRLAARTRFDMEMLLEVGHCPGIENYARWFSGRKPGEPPYTLHRLLPRRFPDGRGRIARHAAAGARHVRRRPQPQAHAGRARLPPAQRPGQSAVALRRVGEARQAGAVHVGDAGRLRAGALRRRGGRAGDPADGPGRSAAARQAGPRPGARPGRGDQEAGRPARSACWSRR